MKKFFVVLVLLLFSSTVFVGCFGDNEGDIKGAPDVNINMTPRQIVASPLTNFENIVEAVAPAVVGISAVYGNIESVGSGVAVADGGYVLTNNHVVEGSNSITVYYANKTSGSAKLIWADPSMDLAIIQTSVNMPYLEMGSSSLVESGQEVIAIGTPLTLQFKHTVTKGIISATNRTIEISNDDGTTSYLQNLMQHDASINPGNSGGPLIDSAGRVVGINTLKVSEAEGIGFAIPINDTLDVTSQLIEHKKVLRPYVGITGRTLDENTAKQYNLVVGVYVQSVDDFSAAQLAGIQAGDVITEFDGKSVKTVDEITEIKNEHNIGDTVTLKIYRNGEYKDLELTFREEP